MAPPPPLRSNRRSRGQGAFVSLSPADPVLIVGGVVSLQARLVFSDLSGLDVTDDAVWTLVGPRRRSSRRARTSGAG